MREVFIGLAIAFAALSPAVRAAVSSGVNQEWCSELLLLRKHTDFSNDSQKRVVKNEALTLLALGAAGSRKLALETLARIDLPEETSREAELAVIRLNILKYLHDDELTELAAVVLLRFYDRAHWSKLRSVEQFRQLKYLDRQKAISDIREMFKDEPWRTHVDVLSIRRMESRLWEIQGEVEITDQLLLHIGGRPVHLIADLENEMIDLRRVVVAGKEVKDRVARVEFDELSVEDIMKGMVARGHFTVELVVEDPFVSNLGVQVSGYMSENQIERVNLKDYLSHQQLK